MLAKKNQNIGSCQLLAQRKKKYAIVQAPWPEEPPRILSLDAFQESQVFDFDILSRTKKTRIPNHFASSQDPAADVNDVKRVVVACGRNRPGTVIGAAPLYLCGKTCLSHRT
jgi:hypothetical protein